MDRDCPKCNGAGWLWWYELDYYNGPASDPHDCYSDDTKYPCDRCNLGCTLCQGIHEDGVCASCGRVLRSLPPGG
jgi:hypothetical protein